MAKILQFPIKNPPTQKVEEHQDGAEETNIKRQYDEFIKNLNAKNLDDANRQLAEFSQKMNSASRADFLGLSAEQMQNLLYTPFKNGNFLSIEEANPEIYATTPIVKQTLFILNKLASADKQRIKLTQTGKWPRALVQEFWAQFDQSKLYTWKPQGEEDLISCVRCRTIMEASGLLRNEKNYFYITKSGITILNQGVSASLYRKLFTNALNKWNWSYGNRFDQLQIIQMSGLFNLYALSKKVGDDFFSHKKIGDIFLKAFPNAIQEVTAKWDKPEDVVLTCFNISFLKHFCVPMGILEQQESDDLKDLDFYKTTKLFREGFCFKP